MILLKLVPADTRISFLRLRKICFVISGAMVLASIVILIAVGLNFGIDFKGGTLIEIKTHAAVADIKTIRQHVSASGLKDVQIQEFGSANEVLIRVGQQSGGEKAQQVVVEKIKKALGGTADFRRVEVVGPTVSGELIQSGIISVISAILAVLVYIWFRFEWQFSIGAVAALVHDVILTIGLFSVLQLEFNLSIIAAILTIVGYSLNDTVVVFDRVRENLRKYKKMGMVELLDLSINNTLSRTVLTSVTTLLALVALYVFGGEVIRGFTFAMIWGVLVGTYSSVFIASPILLMLGVKRDWSGSTVAKANEKPAIT